MLVCEYTWNRYIYLWARSIWSLLCRHHSDRCRGGPRCFAGAGTWFLSTTPDCRVPISPTSDMNYPETKAPSIHLEFEKEKKSTSHKYSIDWFQICRDSKIRYDTIRRGSFFGGESHQHTELECLINNNVGLECPINNNVGAGIFKNQYLLCRHRRLSTDEVNPSRQRHLPFPQMPSSTRHSWCDWQKSPIFPEK